MAEKRTHSRKSQPDVRALEKARKEKNVPESAYLTQMRSEENAVEFEGLQAWFFTEKGIVRSADGVTFDIPKGKTVGVVGESGCGKSVTGLSLMQLLQRPQGQITGGQIRLNLKDRAYDIAKTPEQVMQKLRGKAVSMIFQEPMTALNPVLRIGYQIEEVLRRQEEAGQSAYRRKALKLLQTVGIANEKGVYRMYPHQLSGGMRQRVMIAMALACDPMVIVADEPTTALDVTIQAQILQLLQKLKQEQGSAVLLITHDMGVVAQLADFVVVMYAGRVVERGTVEDIFYHPAHPYTIGLMASKPVVGKSVDRLFSIPGKVPDPMDLPEHCYFRQRCHLGADCPGEYPVEISLSSTHKVSCFRSVSEEEQSHG